MRFASRLAGLMIIVLLELAGWSARCADLFLFKPTNPTSSVSTVDARLSKESEGNSPALRLHLGHRQRWPGVVVQAPPEGWDLSSHAAVVVDLRNVGVEEARFFCRVDDHERKGTSHCVTASVTLAPGESGKIEVPLRRVTLPDAGAALFGMRAYPVGPVGSVDPARISKVYVFVSEPTEDHVFDLTSVRATGTASTEKSRSWQGAFLPFIDTFGQYKHGDWPGKIHTESDFAMRRKEEDADLEAHPMSSERTRYGGWANGLKREATGFFRVEKVDGRWWFIDPEGRLFWSHGLDVVHWVDWTPVDERASWFENFPGDQPAFADFLKSPTKAWSGHYAGRNPRCFSFAAANLVRKYGPEWRTHFANVMHRRLASWGFNTIGNGSDVALARAGKTPYTDLIATPNVRRIAASTGSQGGFPDVFDPQFTKALTQAMTLKKDVSAGDPWCLGYFSDNELPWGSETSLAEATLKSPQGQAAKVALVDMLKSKYAEIAKLNATWGTDYPTWESMLVSTNAPDGKGADVDLKAFTVQIAERYFQSARDAIRAVAPHQLYLGCRFSRVNEAAASAAAKFCDVLSYNRYQESVAKFQIRPKMDVPVMIGEFQFGARDRGPFDPGVVAVENQEARARAYRSYVEGALRNPLIVGTHWFELRDEPTTGRVYDEENAQTGIVDVADTPYPEIVAAVRDVGESLYSIRSGQ